MNKFAVIDFETSGLSPNKGDRAIEVGIILIENGKITKKFDSLINPGFSISSKITQITTITNEMLKKAPSASDVFPKVHDFIRGAVLVAHNANFDKRFFEYEMKRLNLKENHTFLCSLLLSRRLYQWAPDHKLITLVDILNIGEEGTFHRALSDALMTAKLFNRICSDLSSLYEEKIESEFIEKYQKTSKSKLKSSPILKKKIPTPLINNKTPEKKASFSYGRTTSARNILRSQKEHLEKSNNKNQSCSKKEQETQQFKSRPYEERRDDAINKIRASRNAHLGKRDDGHYEPEAQLDNAKVTDVYDVKDSLLIKKTHKTEINKIRTANSQEIKRVKELINTKEKHKKLELEKAQKKLKSKKVLLKKGALKAIFSVDLGFILKNFPICMFIYSIIVCFVSVLFNLFDVNGELSGWYLLIVSLFILNGLTAIDDIITIEYEESGNLSSTLNIIENKYSGLNIHKDKLISLKRYDSYLRGLNNGEPMPFEVFENKKV